MNKIGVIGLLASVAMLALFAVRTSIAPASKEGEVPASVATNDFANTSPPTSVQPTSPAVMGAASYFSNIKKTRKGLPLTDDPFGPDSIAEQAWLDRHGFPNKEQLLAYSQANDYVLEGAAKTGDLIAGIELASRQLSAGKVEAEKVLLDYAADGSTYALNALAQRLGGNPRTKMHDPVKAYAYSRVAELQGDVKIGLVRDVLLSTGLDPTQRLEAEAMALGLHKDIQNKKARKLGRSSVQADMRPYGAQ